MWAINYSKLSSAKRELSFLASANTEKLIAEDFISETALNFKKLSI